MASFLNKGGVRQITGLGLVLVGLVIVLTVTVLAYETVLSAAIYPGVRVWDVGLGGKTLAQAEVALRTGFSRLNEPIITLRAGDQSWSVRPLNLGLQLDAPATAQAAYSVERTPLSLRGLLAHARLLLDGHQLSPVLVYDVGVTRLYLETLADQFDRPPVDAAVRVDGLTPLLTPAQAGRAVDVEASLAALEPILWGLQPADVPLVTYEIPPAVADAGPALAEAQALLNGPLTLFVEAPQEGDPGPWTLQPANLANWVRISNQEGVLHATLDSTAVQGYLETLAPSLAVTPVDARFHFDPDLVALEPISPSVTGRALDVAATVQRVNEQLLAGQREVALVLQPVQPAYPDTITAQEAGIIAEVARGESYFIGSPRGRDHNIRIGSRRFDGIVVAPGETFSFNHYLGEVSERTGYDYSYIISGNRTQLDIGGGICQVSTTAFRAAFYGGYPIVERWAHAYRVGYYELMGHGPGLDSTVYSPYVDFKFENDTPYPVLIETEIFESQHRLVFRFYSTPTGRTVEQIGPDVTEEIPPPPPVYELDPEMAAGTVEQVEKSHPGLTAVVRRIVRNAEGNVIRDENIVSEYQAWAARYHYGPGYTPPATATPTP